MAGRILRRLGWVAGWVVVILLVLAVVGIFLLDGLLRRGVEFAGSAALGVPTTLQKAHISLLRGRLQMEQLIVGNPPGFQTPYFLALKGLDVQVTLGSLARDVVEIPHLTLSGLELYLEKDAQGRANYQTIFQGLKSSEAPPPQPQPSAKPGKKFVIRELVLRDLTVHAHAIGPGGIIQPAPIRIDEIVLHDVGTAGDMRLIEVTGVVVKGVLASAVAVGAGVLPKDMLSELDQGLSQLQSLASAGVRVAGELGDRIATMGRQAAQAVEKIGKEVGQKLEKGAEQIGRGLEEILGGKKKKDSDRK